MQGLDSNNTWCYATLENYGRLIQVGFKDDFDFLNENKIWDLFILENNHIVNYMKNCDLCDYPNYKQIKLNSNNEFEYVEEEDVNPHSPTNFGFEAKEGVEIFAEINGMYFGCARQIENKNTIIPLMWFYDGECGDTGYNNMEEYNLTKKSKPWYEDDSNIGKIIYDTVDNHLFLLDWIDGKGNVRRNTDPTSYRHERFRPATKDEVMKLIVEG